MEINYFIDTPKKILRKNKNNYEDKSQKNLL